MDEDDDLLVDLGDRRRPPRPPRPLLCEEKWVGFAIRGLEAVDSKKRSGFLGMKKDGGFRDAVLRIEISEPCSGDAAPRIDDRHELSRWRSETRQAGEDFEFGVPALLRGFGPAEERVLKVRLEAKVEDGEAAPLGKGASGRVLGVATFLLSDLVRESAEVSAALAPGAGRCVARAAPTRPPRTEAIAAGVGDPLAPRLDAGFRLWPAAAREIVVEPRGTHEIVRGCVQPVADAMLESAAAWLRRSEAARYDAALFDDDAEAGRHGARRARLGILGARGLARRDKDDKVVSNNSSSSSAKGTMIKKTLSAAVGLAKRLRDGEAPRLGLDDGGDSAPPSCFGVAELRSTRRPFPEEIGRTNTEYATESPAWGANARAESSCPHAKPQLNFAVSSASLEAAKRRPIARLRSPADCGDPAGLAPLFEFYARRDETCDDAAVVVVKVYDERYSVTRGVEAVYLGEAQVPLPAPAASVSRCWVPLALAEKKTERDPAVLVSLEVTALDALDDPPGAADAAFDLEVKRRADRAVEDAELLHSWLGVAGVEVDEAAARLASARDDREHASVLLAGEFAAATVNTATNAARISSEGEPPLRLHDCTWLESHARALARDGARLARFASDARTASNAKSSAFKSSQLKADLEVAATPTNLHAHLFSVATDGRTERVWTAATSGAPTAAGTLGAQRGGLLRLESELFNLAASIKKKRADFAALPNAPGRKTAAANLGSAARAWEARAAACGVRKALARAHALSIAVASVRAAACRVATTADATRVADHWERHGILVLFQALVSTAGAELAMLEDAKAAVESLAATTIILAPQEDPDDHHAVAISSPSPAAFVVAVRLPPRLFQNLAAGGGAKPRREISLVPVLFSQGLDAKQSIANRSAALASALSSQRQQPEKPPLATTTTRVLDDDDAVLGDRGENDQDDDDGDFAAAYYDERSPSKTDDSASSLQRVLNAQAFETVTAYARARDAPDQLLAALRAAVDKERLAVAETKSFEKHWLVLVEAERVVRALDGALCVFCKSGKDRTAMIVTLATAMFCDDDRGENVPAEVAVNDDQVLRRANLLREFGLRLKVAEKNTGRNKFAFNVIQRKFLPPPLRPPVGVIEDLVSSAINRDTS